MWVKLEFFKFQRGGDRLQEGLIFSGYGVKLLMKSEKRNAKRFI